MGLFEVEVGFGGPNQKFRWDWGTKSEIQVGLGVPTTKCPEFSYHVTCYE